MRRSTLIHHHDAHLVPILPAARSQTIQRPTPLPYCSPDTNLIMPHLLKSYETLMTTQPLFAVLLCAMLATTPALAEQLLCVSASTDKQLVLYDVDLPSGALKLRNKIALKGSPGSQCISPDGNRLYVSIRSLDSVAVFKIHHKQRNLEHLGTTNITANAAYISLDRTGKTLLWASYSSGVVGSYRIQSNGQLGSAISRIPTARCAHAILTDPSNQYVFAPHTGPNAIYQFHFSPADGKLTPNQPAFVRPADGLEPRHLAFHPTLPVVYCDDEAGASVTAYHFNRETGTLDPFQTVTTLPPDFSGNNSCADIEITSDGRFVYASNRGHNSVAGFAVDLESGKLTAIGQAPTGDTPRSFNLSPDGTLLVAAGQASHDLHSYRRDSTSGKLTRGSQLPTGKGPAWVQFITLR